MMMVNKKRFVYLEMPLFSFKLVPPNSNFSVVTIIIVTIAIVTLTVAS